MKKLAHHSFNDLIGHGIGDRLQKVEPTTLD